MHVHTYAQHFRFILFLSFPIYALKRAQQECTTICFGKASNPESSKPPPGFFSSDSQLPLLYYCARLGMGLVTGSAPHVVLLARKRGNPLVGGVQGRLLALCDPLECKIRKEGGRTQDEMEAMWAAS
jgi:hypothetical protein